MNTWDDGFITLAFSRTFAETGHIGLTPYSEVVEGATSPLWFLIFAAVHKLGVSGMYWLHFASQILSGLCAAASASVFYRLCVPYARRAAYWITLVVFLLGEFRAETVNGMEINLLCLVLLGILWAVERGPAASVPLLATLSALVPWIRFEAVGYLFLGAVALWLFSRNRRTAVVLIASSMISTAVLTAVRYVIFGTLGFTNTMLAKELSPYTPHFDSPAWWKQLGYTVLLDPLCTVLPAAVVLCALLRISGKSFSGQFRLLKRLARRRGLPLLISFGLAYSVGALGVVFVFGSNYYNRPGRMTMSALVVLVLVVVRAVPLTAELRPLRIGPKLAIVGMYLVPVLGFFSEDVLYGALVGRSVVPLPPNLKSDTYSEFLLNGKAAEHVADIFGHSSVSLLTADVGSTALCCSRINILDFGLLANADLVKTGWGGFHDYLVRKRPDLIQAHGVWSEESQLYSDPYFQGNYVPVVVYNSLFYMREDLYGKVKDRCGSAEVAWKYFYSGMEPPSGKRNSSPSVEEIDARYLQGLKLPSLCRLS